MNNISHKDLTDQYIEYEYQFLKSQQEKTIERGWIEKVHEKLDFIQVGVDDSLGGKRKHNIKIRNILKILPNKEKPNVQTVT